MRSPSISLRRFKAYVAVGDFDGHIGLGKKCSSEVATAIRGALIMAKMHLVPIRRGYWGSGDSVKSFEWGRHGVERVPSRIACRLERIAAR